MLYWTLKNLCHEPLRLLLSAFGVAVAFTLVIFFDAVFEGEAEQIVAYPKHAQADVWVMQDGVSNMHMASSLVRDSKETLIREVRGVAGVTSILYLNTVISAGGKQWFSYVVGMDENAPRGGPWKMLRGKSSPATGEAILPGVIARLTGLEIGDTVSVLDRKLRIVGLSGDTFSMANSVTFMAKQDLADIMDVFGSVSYLFVKAMPGVSPQALAERIEQQVEKVNAMPAADFIRRDQEMAMQMGTEIIQIMSLIGTVLATLIVAFTAWQQVMSRQRELAIGRALGFRRGQIYLSAMLQTTVVTLLGFVIAIVIALLILPWIPVLAPTIHLKLSTASFIHLAGLSGMVAVLAALWPARRVARLDPLIVFQS